MIIYVVGNPLVVKDSLPLRLKPKLANKFPDIKFVEVDPTENFIPEEKSVIIDTVVGIDKVILFNSLDDFVDSPKISPHDYDLGFHLKLLKKLKKINRVSIIGIPQKNSFKKTLSEVVEVLSPLNF